MILLCYGTRPEWIKIKPLIEKFKKNDVEYRIIFTGQQKDIGQFEYDWIFEINDGVNRLDSIIGSIMNQAWEIFRFFYKYNTETGKFIDAYVLVQGDTTSAIALALSAFHNGIKIIHLEAGLRTYDRENPYPEELNRRIISQIAEIHLCPTKQAQQNLINEKIYGESYVVGNTVIDNLLPYKDKCEYTNKILVTLHRRENHHWMDRWFIELDLLAKQYPEYDFILPIHPNPNVQKWKHLLTNVKVINPLPYEDMLNLLVKTRLVITDSGGLQEESCFFNKKCLTCRIVTERPEAIGLSTFMVKSPNDLSTIFYEHINDYKIDVECPFGDGHAAEKIMKILKNLK
jgi:UDP-N-acetylglucosamine 2-epimerase (non-hydrolysing)